MAIELTKQSNFGIDATYWYVAYFQKFSFKDKECDVFLHGFKDRQCRYGEFEVTEGNTTTKHKNSPISVALFQFREGLPAPMDFDFECDDNITAKVYEKIKGHPKWKGAIDV